MWFFWASSAVINGYLCHGQWSGLSKTNCILCTFSLPGREKKLRANVGKCEDRSRAMWQNRDSVHFWQTLRGGGSSSVRCGHALFDTTGNRRSVWTSCKVAMAALFKYPSAFDLFCRLCKLKTDPTMILVIREAALSLSGHYSCALLQRSIRPASMYLLWP